jgi:DNA topoisomerase-1
VNRSAAGGRIACIVAPARLREENGLKLIIVESPAKARTIERFLGSEYKVAASYGHVRDLPGSAAEIPERIRGQSWARLGVDTEHDYEPVYVVSPESRKHVAELKKLLKKADELILATDEDREGEAISWHLLEVLEPKIPVRRIAFHEITRGAVQQALASPRDIDGTLVKAQESRRILDRLYGYSLSPVLWKKVRTKLSAGRVQSVAVRLIVEREEERQAFRVGDWWDAEASLRRGALAFTARLVEIGGRKLCTGKDFDPDTGAIRAGRDVLRLDAGRAEAVAAATQAGQPWAVSRVERKETRQRPGPPFITSTLQQAASARLGYSPQRTMRIAQRLYEGIDLGDGGRSGLITYMRTDSLTLSEKALEEAVEVIRSQFGADYTDGPRRYRTQSRTAQEAHEAIRPTSLARTPSSVTRFLNQEELGLYRLIWSRTLASQMTDAILDKTTADLVAEALGEPHVFRANGSVVRFPGFMQAYGGAAKDSLLPELVEGDTAGGPDAGPADVQIEGVQALRHETAPPPRYTEATLVKKLEDEGIGRPSTYAPIITTIQNRGYVLKKSGKLLPTYVGMAVTHLLREHFARYVDIAFTAQMEEDLDAIATGAIDPVDFLRRFYEGRAGDGDGLLESIDRELPAIDFPAIPLGHDPESGEPVHVRIGRNYVYVQLGEGGDGRTATLPVDLLIDELTTERALELIRARQRGNEPLGRNVYVLTGPYGPYVQLGENDGDEKPRRVSLGRDTRLEEVDLARALRLLSLPRRLGEHPETGRPVTAGMGRFGPYVECARVYASLDGEDEIFTIDLEGALERIRNKNRKTVLKDLGHHPETGAPLQVFKGRYGPYVSDGKLNATLGRDADPSDLTLEDALQLLAAAAQRKQTGGKRTSRKKTAKKTAKKTKKKTSKKTTEKTASGKTRRRTPGKGTVSPPASDPPED